jgi:hypothetical protein
MKYALHIAVVACLAMTMLLSAEYAVADEMEAKEEAEPGPLWRPSSLVSLQAFTSVHFIDHSDINNYIGQGRVEDFGYPNGEGYLSRATPVLGLRLAYTQKSFMGDIMLQYYKQVREGPDTGAMLSGVHLLFHVGYNIVQRRYLVYPFFGLGWSYTNFVVNGDERCVPYNLSYGGTIFSDPDNPDICKDRGSFPDFSGAKEGVPGDVGIGFELQNPLWKSKDDYYRKATNIPLFIQIGYQGELITYFWQIKHGRLEMPVLDRFMGPYLRVGLGFGRGKYYR